MSRLVRLTNLLLQLQSKRVVTGKELAEKFKISLRTVYRDIRVLEEAGVPILGEAGEGYSLLEDYRIPPLMFTEAEINALLTASQLLSKNSDSSLQLHLNELVTKIRAILKHTAKEKSDKLEKRVWIFTGAEQKTSYLSLIQSAIINGNVLSLKYEALHSQEFTERKVEPLAVYFSRDNWLLVAHCRMRNALREFRFDRIRELKVSADIFSEREFSFEQYIKEIS